MNTCKYYMNVCKHEKFFLQYEIIVCKYIILLELSIPAFRGFCKTCFSSNFLFLISYKYNWVINHE